jgi:hypothetical protein
VRGEMLKCTAKKEGVQKNSQDVDTCKLIAYAPSDLLQWFSLKTLIYTTHKKGLPYRRLLLRAEKHSPTYLPKPNKQTRVNKNPKIPRFIHIVLHWLLIPLLLSFFFGFFSCLCMFKFASFYSFLVNASVFLF